MPNIKGALNLVKRALEPVQDKALPLRLPRARLAPEYIDQQADRVARQMLGEHVVSGKPKETFNLAGRSKKESDRVKGLDYKLKPIGTVAQETPYVPRKGDINVAVPGDQTISDNILESIEGVPIGSVQQGGARYGLGQKHLDEPEFWKSNEVPAKGIQGKADRLQEMYEPERMIGSHLAMGQTANNFAMHFADANMRAIDWSKATPKKINVFDNIIAGGYKDDKTGERVFFPNWPGLADPDAALLAMKEDSNLRKWFNNRMKVPSITKPLDLPNGLDIQYAISEPNIRDLEINMTGLMTGKLKPGALIEAAGNPHNTYTHRILGEAEGAQEVLTPFQISHPDAAAHIASTKRPSDFTGTIQKVFPHQLVDEQYLNEYGQYRDRIKKLTGKKEGGSVDIKAADARLAAAMSQRMAKGGAVDIEAADARLSAAMNGMAGGGMVTIHPRVHEILKAPLRMKEGGDPLDEFSPPRYRSAGRRPESQNDRVASANMPVNLAGNIIAGALGVPGRLSDIKKNAKEIYEEFKQSELVNSPRARAQLAKIMAATSMGTIPDMASAVTPFINSDAMLSAFPMQRIAKIGVTGTPSLGRRESVLSDETVPYSLADYTNDKDGDAIGGTEYLIKKQREAGKMYGGKKMVYDYEESDKPKITLTPEEYAEYLNSEDRNRINLGGRLEEETGRFHPALEMGLPAIAGAAGTQLGKSAIKAAERLGKGFDKGYARAMSKQEPPFLNELGYDSVLDKQPVKLLGQQPQVMTALPGTPQGATYATKQEGPFYRVSPTTLDVGKAKSRGIREADELQSPTPVGGTAGQAGREVPQLLSPEEVGRIIADPTANEPLQIAKRFTKETQGADFAAPNIPESSLAKQSAIGRAHQLAVEGSPEYKTSVFDAYAKQMPEVLEQSGAKSYDDLMEKAYRQLAKETDEQFQQLPYNFSYHRSGEGNYNGAMDMASDVHGNKHLYVFQGGDRHDFLNRMDKASGLNENEKFRAVHDLLGHAIYGNQFGPKGEEIAWAVHQQMYSPLARLAMTAETRGQNSLVNYSPLNANLKAEIAKYDNIAYEAKRRGDTALVNEINALKRQAYSGFQFAPQKAVLLPPEFISPKFAGGLPDYLSAANKPAKGTESQSALTHFSNSPGLELLDPKRYGTGIKGAEAKRLNEYEGGVKDRSYVYLGEPGTVSPEPGLGVNRYRAESENLYDITKDPLNFRTLARESNRTPFTAKANAGMTYPPQEANDYERLVKEYGYEGMINPNASKPMGIMFKPTPVQPRKRGGLTRLRAR